MNTLILYSGYVLHRFKVVCCIGRQPLYLSAYSYLITVQRVLTSYVQKGSNNDHLPFTRENLSTVQCNMEMKNSIDIDVLLYFCLIIMSCLFM